MRRLEDHEVITIRRRAASGDSIRSLASDYGVSAAAIQKLVTGRSYRDVKGAVVEVGARSRLRSNQGVRNPASILTPTQVIDIRNKATDGKPRSLLAADYHVSRSTIDKIISQENWDYASTVGSRYHPFPDPSLLKLRLTQSRPPPGSVAGTRKGKTGNHVTVDGFVPKVPRPSTGEDQETEIIKLYTDEGLTLKQIAVRIGLSAGGVRNILKRSGVTIRPRSYKSRAAKERSEEDIELSKKFADDYQSMTIEQVAEKHGVSYKFVRKRLLDAGIKLRPRSVSPQA